MPLLTVTSVGSVGIISDTDPLLLPPNAWTGGRNVRFANDAVEKMPGELSVATPSVTPYITLPVIKGGTAYWVYAGLAKAYSWDGSNHVNITRQDEGEDVDYTGTAANHWNGGVFNNILVLNNGVDAPQMWTGTKLEALDWDSGNTWEDKSYTAGSIRPYKNFLVALNWSDGAANYPQSVYWSNQADPNAVPSDWDFADPANEAGIYELAATQGVIIDGEQLRDSFIIYKEDAIHQMAYTGGQFVMAFKDVSRTTGVLAQRCSKEFYGKHFVLAQDDIIVHDGQNVESVASRRVRRTIFANIDAANYRSAFVARNLSKEELWVCYPETGQTLPNIAAVWNWRDNTWTWRELPSVTHIGFGVVPAAADDQSWNNDPNSWDSDTTLWGERLYNPAAVALVAATSSALLHLDLTEGFNGAAMTSYIMREGMLLDGQTSVKLVRAIYPRATGGPLQISIGAKWNPTESYRWEGPYSFTPGTDYVVRTRSKGRFHAVRVDFPGDSAGALHGYDIEYVPMGGR